MGAKPQHVKLRQRRNKIPEGTAFIPMYRELLESDACRTASVWTMRFVFRVMIEDMNHGSADNGKLVVTFNDCVQFGIPRKHIKEAQAEAIGRGLIYRTEKGTRAAGRGRKPHRFGLGWRAGHDGSAPPNLWKRWRARGPLPTNNINSSSHGGTGDGHAKPPFRNNKVPTGVLDKVPTGVLGKNAHRPPMRNQSLPPGWRWGDYGDGHIRALRPGPPGRPWIGAPIIDHPMFGDELERAALAELKAWRNEQKGEVHEKRTDGWSREHDGGGHRADAASQVLAQGRGGVPTDC